MAAPTRLATTVLDTDLTLTGRSTGGPLKASANTTPPRCATTRAWS